MPAPRRPALGSMSTRWPMRDGSDDTRTVPPGSMISARPAPDSATARSTSGASTVQANGSA